MIIKITHSAGGEVKIVHEKIAKFSITYGKTKPKYFPVFVSGRTYGTYTVTVHRVDMFAKKIGKVSAQSFEYAEGE